MIMGDFLLANCDGAVLTLYEGNARGELIYQFAKLCSISN